MIERVAAAMETNFKEVVAFHAGVSFEKTKVEAPAKDVWLRYARAAIQAMQVPNYKMSMAGANSVDRLTAYEAQGIWAVMVAEALK